MAWSGRRGTRWRACMAIVAVLAAAGCASSPRPDPARGMGVRAGCMTAPRPGASPLPMSLLDASAVPGTRRAWVLAGRYGDPFESGNYLLRFSGANWTKAATFAPDIHLAGVSAISASAAWVWGDEGRGDNWPTFRPFLAEVSGGVVRQMRTALLSGVYVSSMATDGASGTWLAGGARDRHDRFRGEVVARWDGSAWHQVPVPAGAGAVWSLSTSGPSDTWAAVSKRSLAETWLVHWDGAAWSRAYTPPASLATDGRTPQGMSAASSAGHAWAAYTEGGTNSGSNARNPPPRTISVYFDGDRWRTVPVPAAGQQGLAEITMAGGSAWAIVTGLIHSPGIFYSYLGSGWCLQSLPHGPHPACAPTAISAASPTYVVAVSGPDSGNCRRSYAFVFDGHRWRSAEPRPAG